MGAMCVHACMYLQIQRLEGILQNKNLKVMCM